MPSELVTPKAHASTAIRVGSSYSEGIFEHGSKDVSPRPMKLRKETSACSWPLRVASEAPRFQSPRWAFDFLAYVDDAQKKVAIAGEAKREQLRGRLWFFISARGTTRLVAKAVATWMGLA
jgi:hypothetical protein